MEQKTLTVIDLQPSGIRIIHGFEHRGILRVLHSMKSKPIRIEGGMIDKEDAIKTLSEMVAELRKKRKISAVIFLVPPIGFIDKIENYRTATANKDSRLCEQDYTNCATMILKDGYIAGKKIVYLHPFSFVLDDKQSLPDFPLGRFSQSLKIEAYVHHVDTNVYDHYRQILEACSLVPYMSVITTFSAQSLMEFCSGQKANYALLNIEEDFTEIGFARNGRLISAEYVDMGLKTIAKSASEDLEVSPEKALEMLYRFGFAPDGGPHYFTDENKSLNDIDQAFNDGLEPIVRRLLDFLKDVPASLPIAFYGASTKIHKFVDVLCNKTGRTLHPFFTKVIGARDPDYIASLGAIHLGSIRHQQPSFSDRQHNEEINTEVFHR